MAPFRDIRTQIEVLKAQSKFQFNLKLILCLPTRVVLNPQNFLYRTGKNRAMNLFIANTMHIARLT